MKTTKKLLALALAVLLVMSLATTAFAYTIKLTGNNDSPTAGHTYDVYQIFTGRLENGVLSDVKYGASYLPEGTTTNTLVPEDVLNNLNDAKAFADALVGSEDLKAAVGQLKEANNWTMENVVPGYYLIVDATKELPENHTRSAYIVQVVDDVNMAPKSGVVKIEKKVQDINDSTDSALSDLQDSADYDIGDHVPYTITAQFTDIAEFDEFYVQITDTMSKGLTYDNNAVITMNYTVINEAGETVPGTLVVTNNFDLVETDYSGEEEKYEGGKVYTFTCADIKALVENEGNLVSATITITYTAELNTEAETGEPGNPNKVNMTYDREPDQEGTGENRGTTPDDTNIVFTYKLNVNKFTKNGEDEIALPGAKFTLDKLVDGNWVSVALIADGATFSATGLDDGIYRLTETEAPAGYNLLTDPIYFKVTAVHDTDSADPKLTDLVVVELEKDEEGNLKEVVLEDGNLGNFTATELDGAISTKVENKAGATLPETGGMGTTLFYVIGGLLVAGAVVLLVTKKRMGAAA